MIAIVVVLGHRMVVVGFCIVRLIGIPNRRPIGTISRTFVGVECIVLEPIGRFVVVGLVAVEIVGVGVVGVALA